MAFLTQRKSQKTTLEDNLILDPDYFKIETPKKPIG